MVEVDDNDAMMDNTWLSPNSSSRTLLSNSSNGSRSFSTFLVENGNLGLPWSVENQKVNVSSRFESEVGVNSLNDLSPQPKLFGDPRSSSFGGLAERMTTRKGFNVPKLDTTNIQSTSIVSSSETPSPYLTIPPGLSPMHCWSPQHCLLIHWINHLQPQANLNFWRISLQTQCLSHVWWLLLKVNATYLKTFRCISFQDSYRIRFTSLQIGKEGSPSTGWSSMWLFRFAIYEKYN